MANPNPTSYVNWARYFGANQSSAKSEAEKLAEQQRKAAEAAQKSTSGLVSQFAQKAGVAGAEKPVANAALTPPASNVGAGAAAPMGRQRAAPTNTGAAAVAPQGPVARAPAGLASYFSPQPGAAPVAPPLSPPGAEEPATGLDARDTNQQLADAQAASQVGYAGPSQLSDLAGYQGALDQNLAAQTGLNSLGSEGGIEALNQQMHPGLTSGQSQFDAALLGTAGRTQFDKLRNQFSLKKDWEQAQERAQALAAMGTEKSRAEADKWAQKADALKLKASGQGVERTLGYGPDGGNEDNGPKGRGINGPAVVTQPDNKGNRERHVANNTQSFVDFAGGNGIASNTNYDYGFSQKQFDSMSPEERDELDDIEEAIKAGKQAGDWSEAKKRQQAFAARIKAKYGSK